MSSVERIGFESGVCFEGRSRQEHARCAPFGFDANASGPQTAGAFLTPKKTMTASKVRAAFFDMDGTLIAGDSSWLYLCWCRKAGKLSRWQVLRAVGWLAQHKLGLLGAEGMAEAGAAVFSGASSEDAAADHHACHLAQVQPRILAGARAVIEQHRCEGHLLAIVTAAITYAAAPLADDLGISHVIATELETRGTTLTGAARGPLCYGQGKLQRAAEFAAGHGFGLENVTFYSDSISDLPLLRAVGSAVVVNPDWRLHAMARRRSWPVVKWA